MTNDELERMMNFAIERQERIDARQERTAENLAQLEIVVQALTSKSLEHDERIARFERSYTVIANLLQSFNEQQRSHQGQIEVVTTNLNAATETASVLIENAVRRDAQLKALAESVNNLTESADRRDAQLEALAESVNNLAENAARHDAQLGALTESAARRDAQLENLAESVSKLTIRVDDLTTTVNRYIASRDNNANGSAKS